MRILLTNDDGISSPGITLLAKALREAGHRVFTVAPDNCVCAASKSKTRHPGTGGPLDFLRAFDKPVNFRAAYFVKIPEAFMRMKNDL